jgi:hypothetical protein
MAGVGRPKGQGKTPGSGRKKGYVTPAVELRNKIIQAFDEVGGHKYLVLQARENPVAFMQLIGKALPKEQPQNNTNDLLVEAMLELSKKLNV